MEQCKRQDTLKSSKQLSQRATNICREQTSGYLWLDETLYQRVREPVQRRQHILSFLPRPYNCREWFYNISPLQNQTRSSSDHSRQSLQDSPAPKVKSASNELRETLFKTRGSTFLSAVVILALQD